MLQVATIREEKDKVITGLKKRRLKNIEETIEKVLSLDQKRKQTQRQQDDLLAESNGLAKEIGNLMKGGQKEQAEKLKIRTAEIKKTVSELSVELTTAEEELQKLLYTLPNVPHVDVPEGGGADDNKEVHRHGDIPALPSDALPHWELIKKYDIIDFDLGNKIAGAGFPVYKVKAPSFSVPLLISFLMKLRSKAIAKCSHLLL
jgi:seryl-tRNA synthetase